MCSTKKKKEREREREREREGRRAGMLPAPFFNVTVLWAWKRGLPERQYGQRVVTWRTTHYQLNGQRVSISMAGTLQLL